MSVCPASWLLRSDRKSKVAGTLLKQGHDPCRVSRLSPLNNILEDLLIAKKSSIAAAVRRVDQFPVSATPASRSRV